MAYQVYPYYKGSSSTINDFFLENPNSNILLADKLIYKQDENKNILKKKKESNNKYFSDINIDNISKLIFENIQHYPILYEYILPISSTSKYLPPGCKINFINQKTELEKPDLFSITNDYKSPFTFDLAIYILDRNNKIIDVLSYKNKNFNQIHHSGDYKKNLLLLHTAYGFETLENNYKIIICVVEYNKNPLINFKNQVPTFGVISNNNLYFITCPLEEAVIGNNNNFAVIGIIKNNSLYTLNNYGFAENIEVGNKSNFLNNIFIECLKDCDLIDIEINKTKIPDEIKYNYRNNNKILHVIQENINIQDINNSIKLIISNLPFSEKISGFINVFACKLFNINWNTIMNCSKAIIHLMPNTWLDSSRYMKVSHFLNGLYILHGFTTQSLHYNQLIEELKKIKTNFMSIIGPDSIIVVKYLDKYLWFDGIGIDKFIKKVFDIDHYYYYNIDLIDNIYPSFGDDVSTFITIFFDMINNDKNVVSKNQTWIKNFEFDWKNEIKQFFEKYLDLSIQKIKIDDEKLIDIVDEKNLLIKNELNKKIKDLENIFSEIIFKIQILSSTLIHEARKYICEFIINFLSQYNIKIKYNMIKEPNIINYKIFKELPIITYKLINKMYSRNSSTIKSQIIKNNNIENNEILNQMSREDYAIFIKDNSYMTIIVQIMNSFLQINNNLNIKENDIKLASYIMLDPLITSIIISQTLSPIQFNNSKLMIPQNSENLNNSALCIPIIKKYINIYFDEINIDYLLNDGLFLYFRILLRNELTSIPTSPFNGEPTSPKLFIFIINMYLSICELLIQNNETELEFNDTLSILIRGIMFHILTTCAAKSGSNISSLIYKIVYKTTNLYYFEAHEWKFIIRIYNILKKINYNQDKLNIILENISKSFNNFLHKQYESMNLSMNLKNKKIIPASKKEIIDQKITIKNRELQWIKLVAILFEFEPTNNIDKEKIKRILEFFPYNIFINRSEIQNIKRTAYKIKDHLNYYLNDNYPLNFCRQIIVQVINKRSGWLTNLKNKSLYYKYNYETYHKHQSDLIKDLCKTYNVNKEIIKLQNKTLQDKKTFDFGIKGDGEINRYQWSITLDKTNIFSKKELITRISYILNKPREEIEQLITENIVVPISINTMVQEETNFIDKLKKTLDNNKIIKYYKQLNQLSNSYEKVFNQPNTSKYMSKELFDEICSIIDIKNIDELINQLTLFLSI